MIVLLAKTKSSGIEVLISKALNGSFISHDEFVLVNNVLKEYDEMKEEIKNFNLFIRQCFLIVWSVEKI